MKKILREPEVRERTGLDRTTRWRLSRAGKFPQPVELGSRARGWLSDEVDRWIDARQAARDQLKR